MKKVLNLMIAFVCVLSCAFVFSGCDITKSQEPTKSYIVQFYNYDGTLVKEISVEENTSATCETPTKESTQYYVYEFSNWEFLDGTDATEDLESVTKTLTVRAKFNEVQPTYTINFYDEGGQTLLDTKTVLRGDNSSFLSTNPTKLDELYNYEFDCWVDGNDVEIENLNIVQSNINLYAKYNNVGQHSFVVKFYSEDKQTVLKEEIISSGSSIAYTTTKPTSIEGLEYDLDCWEDNEGNKVTSIQKNIDLYPVFGLNVTDTINNLKYSISQDKTYYTLGAAKTKTTSSEVKILSNINSIPVKKINAGTFYQCESLTKIEIPNTITNIGHDAFYRCLGITEVNYLGDVDSWASIEFEYKSSNPLFYSNRATLKINDQTLTHANITKATEIKQYAFIYCTSLKQLTLGSSVTTIGKSAFDACELISVTVNPSVKTFGYCAFDFPNNVWNGGTIEIVDYLGSLDEWMSIDFVSGPSNPLYHGAVLKVDGKIVTNINIDIIDFDSLAFLGCSSLTDVIIGENVTTIGDWTFNHCWSLTNVTIGSSLTSIGGSAFGDCPSLTTITIDSPTIANGVVGEYDNGCLVQKAKTIYIKSDLTISNATYLLENFTKQAISDKAGYDMYVRNAE